MASTRLSTVTVFVCGHSMSSTLPWRKPLTAFGELSLWLAVCTSVLQSNIYKLVDQMCALNHQNVAMVLIFQVYCSQHVRFMRTPVFDLSKSSGGGGRFSPKWQQVPFTPPKGSRSVYTYGIRARSQTKKYKGAPAQSKGALQLQRLWTHHPCK